MNACPDCDKPLAQSATSCGCGWELSVDSVPDLHACAHCSAVAKMRVQTPEGWENVCEAHYVEHSTIQAKDALGKLGLNRRLDESHAAWQARLMEWLRNNASVKKFGKAA